MHLSLVTWNLQGGDGVDTAMVARKLSADGTAPSVVLLQEVHRGHVVALARALHMRAFWRWKHWPIVRGIEGLGVLTAGRITRQRTLVVEHAPFWSYQRRIVVMVEVVLEGERVVVVNAHLSPYGLDDKRQAQAERVRAALERFAPGEPAIVAGDLNDHPGNGGAAAFAEWGWRDAWAAVHGDLPEPAGATNWLGGEPRIGRSADQRIDYVFAPAGWDIGAAEVPPSDGNDEWPLIADHLPLSVTLTRTV